VISAKGNLETDKERFVNRHFVKLQKCCIQWNYWSVFVFGCVVYGRRGEERRGEERRGEEAFTVGEKSVL
jgi:hypothetical protein